MLGFYKFHKSMQECCLVLPTTHPASGLQTGISVTLRAQKMSRFKEKSCSKGSITVSHLAVVEMAAKGHVSDEL